MRAFTKDTIETELARIQHNMNMLTHASNELKKRPSGQGISLGYTLATFMDRLSSLLDNVIDDTQTSIRELYVLLNHK